MIEVNVLFRDRELPAIGLEIFFVHDNPPFPLLLPRTGTRNRGFRLFSLIYASFSFRESDFIRYSFFSALDLSWQLSWWTSETGKRLRV
jgi:hypothetical protein